MASGLKCETDAYNEKYYETMDKGYEGIGSVRFLTLVEELSKLKGSRILDAGCGSGFFLPFFRENFSEIYGMDFSKSSIEAAKKKTKQYKNIHIFQQDLSKRLVFKDDFFDVILCSEVIEHVELLDNAISELKRILKKDGTLIITVPIFDFLSYGAIEEAITSRFMNWVDKTHLHKYSVKKWENIIGKHFIIEKKYTSTHHFTKVLNKAGVSKKPCFTVDKICRKMPGIKNLGRNAVFVLKKV